MTLCCPNFLGRFYCKPWRIWIILLHLTKAFNWNFIHARPRQKNERKKGGEFPRPMQTLCKFFLEDLQKSHLTFDNFGKIVVLVDFSIPKFSAFFGPTWLIFAESWKYDDILKLNIYQFAIYLLRLQFYLKNCRGFGGPSFSYTALCCCADFLF